MPEANTLLIVGLCLVLSIPLVLYGIGHYVPPQSYREALKGSLTWTGTTLLTLAAFKLVLNYLGFEHLRWQEMAAGFVAGGVLRLIIDVVVLRRRQGNSEL